MSVAIMHAVANEFGTARGGQVGDPSNKEVVYGKWYAKNRNGQTWAYYIEVLDARIAEAAARMAEQIVENPGIGYGQEGDLRGTLYTEALKHGNVTDIQATCDCSSMILAIFALLIPGFSPKGNTGSMLTNFQKFPNIFRIYRDPEHLFYDDYAKRGGVYLRVGHVLMVRSNGRKARTSSIPEMPVPVPAPVLGQVVMDGIKQWCNVRSGPGKENPKIGIAKVNEVFELLGVDEEWYHINFHGRDGWVFYEFASEMLKGNV